jgi:hypothetical protein
MAGVFREIPSLIRYREFDFIVRGILRTKSDPAFSRRSRRVRKDAQSRFDRREGKIHA